MPQEITQILHEWKKGDDSAVERLFPFVYEELKRRARTYLRGERANHTLQPTALVHEAYMRLVDVDSVDWQDRVHFLRDRFKCDEKNFGGSCPNVEKG